MQRSIDSWDAPAYERLSRPMFEWGKAVVAELSLDGDELVADAGCGTGRVSELLLRRLDRGHLIAIDQSPDMLELAARRLQPIAPGRVTVLEADLLNLAIEPVDLMVSTATLHWIVDHDRLFASLASAIRPGGQLRAQCGAEGNLDAVFAAAWSAVIHLQLQEHFVGFTYPAYFPATAITKQRLLSAGFVSADVWTAEAPSGFGDRSEVHEFLEKIILTPWLSRLPAQCQAAFLDHACDQLQTADGYRLDYRRLNISAIR